MNLFVAFKGKHLVVSELDDNQYCYWYPDVNHASEYRVIDAWLDVHPRRRGTRRFVRAWLKEEQRRAGLKLREARVGSFDPGPVKVKPAALERARRRK